MVRNYVSNNIDLVQPTQYPISKNRRSKKPPPAPETLPAFTPLPIHNENEYGEPNLPDYQWQGPMAVIQAILDGWAYR